MYSSNYKVQRGADVQKPKPEGVSVLPEEKEEKVETSAPATENCDEKAEKGGECAEAPKKPRRRKYKVRGMPFDAPNESVCQPVEEKKCAPHIVGQGGAWHLGSFDELLILALAIFLLSEGCDELLILAICFVLS